MLKRRSQEKPPLPPIIKILSRVTVTFLPGHLLEWLFGAYVLHGELSFQSGKPPYIEKLWLIFSIKTKNGKPGSLNLLFCIKEAVFLFCTLWEFLYSPWGFPSECHPTCPLHVMTPKSVFSAKNQPLCSSHRYLLALKCLRDASGLYPKPVPDNALYFSGYSLLTLSCPSVAPPSFLSFPLQSLIPLLFTLPHCPGHHHLWLEWPVSSSWSPHFAPSSVGYHLKYQSDHDPHFKQSLGMASHHTI